jgi:hypothetical protein
MAYRGSCHCGALTYFYDTELPPEAWPIRACQCSFCRAHGASSTSDPRGTIAFHAEPPDRLRRYRFGHRVTQFLLCAECGVYVGAVTEISGSLFAIINTNALRAPPAGLKPAMPVDYEGESAEMRTERRRSRWTPCAGITGGGGAGVATDAQVRT